MRVGGRRHPNSIFEVDPRELADCIGARVVEVGVTERA
jgi:hypothetical protein